MPLPGTFNVNAVRVQPRWRRDGRPTDPRSNCTGTQRVLGLIPLADNRDDGGRHEGAKCSGGFNGVWRDRTKRPLRAPHGEADLT